jgi:hypothetical protein
MVSGWLFFWIVIIATTAVSLAVYISYMGIVAILPTVPFWGQILVGIFVVGPVTGIVLVPFYVVFLAFAFVWAWWENRKELKIVRDAVNKDLGR